MPDDIECDAGWRTQSARIQGHAGRPVSFVLLNDGHGTWTSNGEPLVEAAGLFVAQLDTDAFGRVLRYEGLWEAEFSDPPTPLRPETSP